MKILLGLTGSVAAIKLPELVQSLSSTAFNTATTATTTTDDAVQIQIVPTPHALHFLRTTSTAATVTAAAAATTTPHPLPLVTDDMEWNAWSAMGDPVLHIDLRNWADMIIIAPLDANTLAKLASGLCDNLLTCILRAWDSSKPVVVCPAMNTHMWTHVFTARHLDILSHQLGYHIIPPVSKTLACGDAGMGGMAAPADIARISSEIFRKHQHQSTSIAAALVSEPPHD